MADHDSLTPEQLGEMLAAGEITREEAVEIMSQRIRRESLQSLYAPPGAEAEAVPASDPAKTRVSNGGGKGLGPSASLLILALLGISGLIALLVYLLW